MNVTSGRARISDRYPPLGLLKIGRFHRKPRRRGPIRPGVFPQRDGFPGMDRIYVS
jgi:hypothetical protein